jgi:hypothetical protein
MASTGSRVAYASRDAVTEVQQVNCSGPRWRLVRDHSDSGESIPPRARFVRSIPARERAAGDCDHGRTQRRLTREVAPPTFQSRPSRLSAANHGDASAHAMTATAISQHIGSSSPRGVRHKAVRAQASQQSRDPHGPGRRRPASRRATPQSDAGERVLDACFETLRSAKFVDATVSVPVWPRPPISRRPGAVAPAAGSSKA